MQEEQVLQEQSQIQEQANEQAEVMEATLITEENTEQKSENEGINILAEELRKLETAYQEEKEAHIRLQADFVNFRKRKEKEAAELALYANEALMKQLLPVLDDFERSLAAMEKTDNLTVIKDGISLVARNMAHILNKVGLEKIEAKGQAFDPELHEAITTLPVEDEAQKGIVFDEIEKGYKLKEKVIRFAKVVVGE